MKHCINILRVGLLSLLVAACASTPPMINPAPGRYRSHWTIPFDDNKATKMTLFTVLRQIWKENQ